MMNKLSLLVVDKPKDLSSNHKLMEIKKQFNIKKCGFVGTLDPFATGLLLVCCNNYTKLVDYFHSFSKTYIAEIKFGATTKTLDSTSEIYYEDNFQLTLKQLQETISKFNNYDQVPPMFSAKKVNGKRAYELARENKEVVLKSKNVDIINKEIISLDLENNIAVCKFEVSSGTYIRTLCDDIAIAMNTRAYLLNLRRTHIGPISVEDTNVDLDQIFKINNIEIGNDFELRLVKNGQIPKNQDLSLVPSKLVNVIYKQKKIALFTKEGKLILFYD